MPGILIVAHAPLASAMGVVASHVDQQAARLVAAVDVQPDWSAEKAESMIRAALKRLGCDQVLILADVFGATPANAAARVADGVDRCLVCGVNVPMLWRAMDYCDEPMETLIERALTGATRGVLRG
jgi:PTS system mannose-specific IIA component